jgi:uncharacterized membrane protein
MVVFHAVFDLRVVFGLTQINYHEGFWFYEGRVAAIIFIVLVGIVSSLICQREDSGTALRKNCYRGIRLIGLGAVVTLITLILAPENAIWFGILHFLGVAVLISIPMCRYKWVNIILAAVLFAAYYPVKNFFTTSYLGIIFGILPPSFSSFDHYALIPWLGYVLIGIALGNWFYPEGLPLIKRPPTLPERWLLKAGKRSLWIYFIHQPLLIGALWLYFRFR